MTRDLLQEARLHIGGIRYKTYKAGVVQDPQSGLNCYGFIKFILTEKGLYVPAYMLGIREMWKMLPVTGCEETDLAFTNGRSDHPGHVGFYDRTANTLIHCSKELGGVAESPMDHFDIKGYRSIPLQLRT